jgi:hypothetical protein
MACSKVIVSYHQWSYQNLFKTSIILTRQQTILFAKLAYFLVALVIYRTFYFTFHLLSFVKSVDKILP